ncbi:MAG: hypothetical protein HON39_01220 [Marinovum sp.]|nr:hypothetical protein [Marinovum sp.]
MQVIFETGPKGSAALFSKPVNMILARHSSELDAALDRMDAALDEGYWIAGYFNYELGYAIESKLLNLMPKERRIPLISLGSLPQNGLPPIITTLLRKCMDIFRRVIFIRQI